MSPKEYRRKYYEKNKEVIKARARDYYYKNRTRCLQRRAKYRVEHREAENARNLRYQKTERYKTRRNKWLKGYRRRKNIHSDPIYTRQWRLKNMDYVRQYRREYVWFKDKRIHLGFDPRTGECSDCHRTVQSGAIKMTNMDHLWYDDDNPLAGTIERCVGCHQARHNWLMKMARLIVPDLNNFTVVS